MKRPFAAISAVALAGGLTALAAPATTAGGQTASATAATTVTFTESGQWTVPATVTCAVFQVYGARGGDGSTFDEGAPTAQAASGGGVGGNGGLVTATAPVSPGAVYDLGVGQRGEDGQELLGNAAQGTGGYGVHAAAGSAGTGGAPGGGNGSTDNLGGAGGGGGGFSSVSVGGGVVIVAAGGGGGGAEYSTDFPGADGGTDEAAGADSAPNAAPESAAAGYSAAIGGGGATAVAGGVAGVNSILDGETSSGTAPTAGASGQGGNGGAFGDGGGGGGGGVFGGGGGGAGFTTGGAGGGGGSNLAPQGATVQHGVDAGQAGNGLVVVRYTPGDTSCIAAEQVTLAPKFTG